MMLSVANSRILRGQTYLPHGQKYTGWVPAGQYDVGDLVQEYIDRECSRMADARVIVRRNMKHAEKWYIGEAVYQQIIKGEGWEGASIS